MAASPPLDYCIQGEGEEMVVQLAVELIGGEKHRAKLRGGSDKVIRAQRIEDLDRLPMPFRSREYLGNYRICDVMWPPTTGQVNVALVLASRGCCNSCDFCASSTVWGSHVRNRSSDNIVRELVTLKEEYETNAVVLIDQSFGQKKAWTLDVCKAIQDADLGMNWYHQSNLTIPRDVIKAMADAGCTKIGFGLEGLSPRAAQRVKPVHPHDFEYINDLFDYCTSLGLFVKAYLMIGFPWEDEDIIREYFEWLPCLRASQIKIS